MTTDRARIELSFSLYLDLVRFLAALLVVLTHFRQCGVVDDWQASLLPFAGRESVIVFFVLSGFVIAYSTRSKAVSMGDYFIARLTRIYSVVLPVLLLSFIVAAVLNHLFGQGVVQSYQLDKAYKYVPFHLLFMGEFWTLSETPPFLSPYWSLSHEVWYYVLFGIACYLRGLPRLVLCACVIAAMGHKLWLLFPVWGAGVALFHWLEGNTISQRTARIGWLVSVALLVAYNISGLEDQLRPLARAAWPFAGLRLGSGERVIGDYLVCVLVVVNFACARFAGFSLLQRFASPIRSMAFFTFSLYLAHALVLGVWRALHRDDAGNMMVILSITLMIVTSTWALGHGAEFLRLRALAWSDAWKQGRAARPRRNRTALQRIMVNIWSRIREADFHDPLAPREADTLKCTPENSMNKEDAL